MSLIQQIPPTMRFMKMIANCRIFVFSDSLKKPEQHKLLPETAEIILFNPATPHTQIEPLFYVKLSLSISLPVYVPIF